MKTPTPPSIAIIGSGRVASAIGVIFKSKGVPITSVYSRNENSGKNLAATLGCMFISSIKESSADIFLICVDDDEIKGIVDQLPVDQKIIYTAGSVELETLNRSKCGVFYPLQTFTDTTQNIDNNFPILIESKEEGLMDDLIFLCEHSELHYEKCSSERRKQYHLVAVLLNNFVNHLIHLSQEEARKRGLSWNVLQPLLEKTCASIEQNIAKDSQTGPARRGDMKTLKKHEQMLNERTKEIYQKLSQSIMNTYKDEL